MFLLDLFNICKKWVKKDKLRVSCFSVMTVLTCYGKQQLLHERATELSSLIISSVKEAKEREKRRPYLESISFLLRSFTSEQLKDQTVISLIDAMLPHLLPTPKKSGTGLAQEMDLFVEVTFDLGLFFIIFLFLSCLIYIIRS